MAYHCSCCGYSGKSAASLSTRACRASTLVAEPDFESAREELAERVSAIAERYPLYANLGVGAAV